MTIATRYVSTSKASKILGVSTTLVKTLVDEHKLQAWKTQGGHRRISLDSIEAYISGFMAKRQSDRSDGAATAYAAAALTTPSVPSALQDPRLSSDASWQAAPAISSLANPQIAVSVQTPALLSSIRACLGRVVHSGAMSLPRLVDSPLRALQEMAVDRPNVVLLELSASQAEQEKILNLLGTIEPEGPPISVLVVTPNADLRLPALRGSRCCLHVFSGPVSLDWSRGCWAGMLTLLTSLQWTLPEESSEHTARLAPHYAVVA